MTTDTFVRTVRGPIEEKLGRALRGSEISKLRHIGKYEVENKAYEKKTIVEAIQAVFRNEYALDRHVWTAIEKSL